MVYLLVWWFIECAVLVFYCIVIYWGPLATLLNCTWIIAEVMTACFIYFMANRLHYVFKSQCIYEDIASKPEYEMVAQPTQDIKSPSCAV